MKSKKFSPIALFLYNRHAETSLTVNCLTKCKEALDSELYVFIDGPKSENDKKIQEKIKLIIKENSCNFKKVIIHTKNQNQGLGTSVIQGINKVFEKNDSIIVLEDDILVEPNFLLYMNNALNFYNKSKVFHISAWTPLCFPENKVYKSRHMFCWGWATWKDKWKYYDKNPTESLKFLNERKLTKIDFNFFNRLSSQIEANKKGLINTWAVFWHLSIYKSKGVCINPPKNLITNIGMENGTNHKTFNYTDKLFCNKILSEEAIMAPLKTLKGRDFEIKVFYLFKNYFMKIIDFLYRKLMIS